MPVLTNKALTLTPEHGNVLHQKGSEGRRQKCCWSAVHIRTRGNLQHNFIRQIWYEAAQVYSPFRPVYTHRVSMEAAESELLLTLSAHIYIACPAHECAASRVCQSERGSWVLISSLAPPRDDHSNWRLWRASSPANTLTCEFSCLQSSAARKANNINIAFSYKPQCVIFFSINFMSHKKICMDSQWCWAAAL